MLNSLIIKNFRALENFEVKKLGRVNLIVGKNNSGKSTILEALRIYAGAGNRSLLRKIAKNRDEKSDWHSNEQPNKSNLSFPFENFFTGRQFPNEDNKGILIGESLTSPQCLEIQPIFTIRQEKIEDGRIITSEEIIDSIAKAKSSNAVIKYALKISQNTKSFRIKLFEEDEAESRFLYSATPLTDIPYRFISTRFVSMDNLAQEWDNIVFTEHEKIVHDALKIILPDFENLVFVEKEYRESDSSLRTAKIKLSNLPRPISLKSLGDGMLKILQLVLKIFPTKGGFLLIDEFENGLHYSVQEKVWALLFEMAEKLDIQVFATTHSWDCIESFTKVASANEKTQGILFRMGKSAKKDNYGQTIATIFDREALYDLTQADVEVR